MKTQFKKNHSTLIRYSLLWRIEQLNSGRVELTYGQATPDIDSQTPSDALDLVGLENNSRKSNSRPYKATFKAIDTWRNLTGNIKEH